MRYPNLTRIIGDCTKCKLHETRRMIVIGKGAIPATVLFVGEAPGNSEDATGIPFFGASGKLLDRLLKEAEFTLPYYITNSVLCHPTDKIGGSNREPDEEEVFSCRSNLLSIYDFVSPRLTIFVGKVAEGFYKKIFRPHETILHPAYLLRTGGRASPYYQLSLNKLRDIICHIAD